jgi:hypothetical protein
VTVVGRIQEGVQKMFSNLLVKEGVNLEANIFGVFWVYAIDSTSNGSSEGDGK